MKNSLPLSSCAALLSASLVAFVCSQHPPHCLQGKALLEGKAAGWGRRKAGKGGFAPLVAAAPQDLLVAAALSSAPLAAWPAEPVDEEEDTSPLTDSSVTEVTHPLFVLQGLLLELLKHRTGSCGRLGWFGRGQGTGDVKWGAPRGSLLEGIDRGGISRGRSCNGRWSHRKTRRRMCGLRATPNDVSCRGSFQWGWLLYLIT